MLILESGVTPTEFCQTTAGLWGLLGIAVTAIKVVIPIILIVLGMLDMGKAVTSGKDDEIKKQLKVFLFRAVAAVLVFFIPSIVGLIMQTVNKSLSKDGDIKAEGTCGYSECIQNVTGISSSCK